MEAKEKADLLIKLLQNEDFLARFNDVEGDAAKTKELFASEGLDLSDDQMEVIVDALKAAKKSMYNGEPLTEDQMDEIAGGGILRRAAIKALVGAILAGGLYYGYKVYKGVQERGGVKNQQALDAMDKAKEIANQGKEKAVNAGQDIINLLSNSNSKQ